MAKANLLFHIVSTSGVPIYRQLMDQIRAMIATGSLKPGVFLPSIRELGKTLEINPMTVSKVYSILERDGIVENVRGQGMRVVGPAQSKATLKERRDMIMPALQQVINTATQLKLEKKDILSILDNLWKE